MSKTWMHINFVAAYQGATASLQTKTRKHKLHISASSPPLRYADALLTLLRRLGSSKYIKKILKLIYAFDSALVKYGVWIKVGPQPLFPAESGLKNGWADPNSVSRFELIKRPYFTWT